MWGIWEIEGVCTLYIATGHPFFNSAVQLVPLFLMLAKPKFFCLPLFAAFSPHCPLCVCYIPFSEPHKASHSILCTQPSGNLLALKCSLIGKWCNSWLSGDIRLCNKPQTPLSFHPGFHNTHITPHIKMAQKRPFNGPDAKTKAENFYGLFTV